MKWLLVPIIALLTFYASCELTRVIVARLPIEEMKVSYTVIELGQGIVGTVPLEATRSIYQPWNFYAEIAFIWAGWIISMVIIGLVIKKWNSVSI